MNKIAKIMVEIAEYGKVFTVRYKTGKIREYRDYNKCPETIKDYIRHTPYTAETIIKYGKKVDVFRFESTL